MAASDEKAADSSAGEKGTDAEAKLRQRGASWLAGAKV